MQTNSEILLRAILSVISRQTFSPEQLATIVLKRSGEKQLRAFNLCDGTRTQGQIAKEVKLDEGNFSGTVKRWIEEGILFRLGEGRDDAAKRGKE